MIYNNNDDDDDDDDVKMMLYKSWLTISINFEFFLSVSNWIARQYFYYYLGFGLSPVLFKNESPFIWMRDYHIIY